MRRWTRQLIPAGLLLAAGVRAIPAQQPTQAAALVGTVTDDSTGMGLPDAEVSIPLLHQRVVTSADGRFRLAGLPAGALAVEVRRIGFLPRRDTVTLAADQTLHRDYALTRQVTVLDTVHTTTTHTYISPALRAFEERRARGFGHFISEETLRKNDDKMLNSVILSQIPGVYLVRVNGSIYLASGRKQAPGPVFLNADRMITCFVTVYMDGARIWDYTQPAATRPDFSRLSVRDFAGVEYHPGGATLPAGYSPMNSDCGVLLLWTRER